MGEQHASAMHQHAFFQVPLEHNHAYRNEAQQVSHESASYSQRNKAIMKQVWTNTLYWMYDIVLPHHVLLSIHLVTWRTCFFYGGNAYPPCTAANIPADG